MSAYYVGDPVDVITGAQFDEALDFRIAWPFPFEWKRFYSTARGAEYLPLGWGHTHSYDHRLSFTVDGILYVDPSGIQHTFAYPEKGGPPSVFGTSVLRRAGPETFRVKVKGFPECEFFLPDPARPAQLRRVLRGRAFHELRYTPDGRWTELAYKTEGAIGIESDASGRIQALVWRGLGGERDRLLWQGEYDGGGNLVRVLDPYQNTQSFRYDAAHRMIWRTDRRGYGFVSSYDSAGRCELSAGEDGMQEVRLRYTAGTVTVVTHADGGAWQYIHPEGRVTQIVDPYGGITRRMYLPDGRLEREIGPMNEVLQEIVDDESGLLRPPFSPPVGRCLPMGDPWLHAVRNVYRPADALGWEGYGETNCRNAIRFPRKEKSSLRELPAAVLKSLRFAASSEEAGPVDSDAPARIVPAPMKSIGVPQRPGVFRYDVFGLLVSHTLPTGQTCRWQYDPNGNVTRYIDYEGSEWRYEYASWNLLVGEADPLGDTTSWGFNQVEKPIRITDAGGTATEHAFDLKERMVERRRHQEVRDLFTYDLSGGVTTTTTGRGEVRVALKQGPHRRPVEIAPTGQPLRQCAYDDQGRLTAVTEEEGNALTFSYASLGDCTADLRNGMGAERRYDTSELVACVSLGKFETQYLSDDDGGEITIIDPMGGRHSVRQLDTGIFLRHHANGAEELAQFDWNGQCLAKIRFRRDEKYRLWSRVYRYSPEGKLQSTADSLGGTSTYDYDAAYRLVRAKSANGSSSAFTYDRAGNLLNAPELRDVSYSQNRLLAANGRQFEYNQRHHIAREFGSGEERRYDYDTEDRLTICRIGGRQVSFEYDALGRRVAKTTPEGATQYIWDGERLAAEISPTGSLRVYVYPDGAALTPFLFIDYESPDAAPESGERRYIFSDQICCPVRVEDDAGNVLWRANILPYGRALIQPGATIELNLRWPGHYYDSETGLHYNRYRYYSPELGRYIQVDPRDIEGGLNLYAYTARPLDEVDVDGLKPCPKKAMVQADEDDKAFQKAKRKADKLADDLRKAIKEAVDNDEMHPQAAAGTTLTAMVVLGKNGKWRVVVTGNRSDRVLPDGVVEAIGKTKYIAYGDDSPPPVRQEDGNWRYGRTKPDGTEEDTTHRHAEQRGLRATDCDKDTQGVGYIAPTRPCCEGCSGAIQDRGGDSSNVSDLGKQPGKHGNWWED